MGEGIPGRSLVRGGKAVSQPTADYVRMHGADMVVACSQSIPKHWALSPMVVVHFQIYGSANTIDTVGNSPNPIPHESRHAFHVTKQGRDLSMWTQYRAVIRGEHDEGLNQVG